MAFIQSGAIKYFFIGYFVVVAPTGALQPSVILQRDFGNLSALFSLLTATLSSFSVGNCDLFSCPRALQPDGKINALF